MAQNRPKLSRVCIGNVQRDVTSNKANYDNLALALLCYREQLVSTKLPTNLLLAIIVQGGLSDVFIFRFSFDI